MDKLAQSIAVTWVAALSLAACTEANTGRGVEVVSIAVDVPANVTTGEAFCEARTYTCTPACTYSVISAEGGGQAVAAGTASWLESGNDVAFTLPAESCGAQIPLETEYGALVDMQCCCEIPAQTRVEVDVRSPRSCDAVCADEGLVCEPDTFWEHPSVPGSFLTDTSASLAVYYHALGGPIEQGDCASAPPAVDGDYVLEALWCGCTQARSNDGRARRGQPDEANRGVIFSTPSCCARGEASARLSVTDIGTCVPGEATGLSETHSACCFAVTLPVASPSLGRSPKPP